MTVGRLGVAVAMRFGLIAIALTLASTGCGVQPDDEPRSLAAERVPYGLVDRPTPRATTTTARAVDRINVAVYFLVGERLQPTARAVPDPPTPTRVINALLEGPTDEEAVNGFRTAVNPTTQATVTRSSPEIVTVDLTPDFAAVSTQEQRLAIGQIVFTATGLEDVKGVRFLVGGAPVGVPLPDGTVTADPVDRQAFPSIAPATSPTPA